MLRPILSISDTAAPSSMSTDRLKLPPSLQGLKYATLDYTQLHKQTTSQHTPLAKPSIETIEKASGAPPDHSSTTSKFSLDSRKMHAAIYLLKAIYLIPSSPFRPLNERSSSRAIFTHPIPFLTSSSDIKQETQICNP